MLSLNSGFYGFPNILGLLRASAVKVTGKAGATNGAALAGGTASGAPTSGGPFDVGDVIVDATGSLWICTTAGTSQSSPGTFTQVGGGFSDPTTTKGDLIVHGSSTTRLGVGSDTQVLTADSTQSSGLKWAAAGGGGALTQLAQTVLGASAASITFGSISGSYSTLLVAWDARSDAAATNNTPLLMQLNSDTGSTYLWVYGRAQSGNAATFSEVDSGGLATSLHVGDMPGATGLANASGGGRIEVYNYGRTTFYKHLSSQWGFATGTTSAGAFYQSYFGYGQWDSTAAITSILLFPSSGNFIAGTVMTLYGLS